MPDTRRTVEEDFEAFAIDYCRKQGWLGKDGLPLANAYWAYAARAYVEEHEDALIGCQGRVVYTAEDVEAAGKAFWEQTRYLRVDKLNDVVWEELSPRRRIELCEEAQAILTAAGGVVAEEVRTFAGYEKASLKVTKPREVVGIPLKVHPGDILYIVRAKEE